MFWFRLSGSFLLRFAARQFLPLLFQLPPRRTRAEARARDVGRIANPSYRDNGSHQA